MKIAFDAYPICSKNPSGVGLHAYYITKYICQKYKDISFELLVYDFLKRHNSARLLAEKITDVPVLQNNIVPFGVYVELWDYFKKLSINKIFGTQADIFHFFNFVVPPGTRGAVINTVHDMVYFTYPDTMLGANRRRLQKNLRRSCDCSDIIITVSNNSKAEIINYLNVDKRKIKVIYNGVDLNIFNNKADEEEIRSFKTKYNLPQEYFLYIGTLEPRKNLLNLLKAYAAGKKKFGGCKLVIAGARGWEFNEIFSAASNLGISDDVIFTGYIPAEELRPLYAGARAFMFVSLYEGFGMPALEAMSCGVPVISSNTSSLPEVIGDCGIMTDPENIEEIACSMEKMLNDETLRRGFIEKGLERVQAFSWEKAADEVVEIYRDM